MTKKKYKNAELIFDWQTPAKGEETTLSVEFGGEKGFTLTSNSKTTMGISEITDGFAKTSELKAPGGWNRTLLRMDGEKVTVIQNGKPFMELKVKSEKAALTEGAVTFSATGPVSIMHPYILELK